MLIFTPFVQGVKLLFKNNRILLALFGAFIVSGAIVLLIADKTQLHLFFNSFVPQKEAAGTPPFINTFFTSITYLGDGFFVVLILLLFVFINLRLCLAAGLAYALSGGIAQLLKNFIFNDTDRPLSYFQYTVRNLESLRLVPGVEMFSENSFPSGHTTAAFALFFSLALVTHNSWLKSLCFIVALTVGISRVYLSQHFFADIYAGAIIGGICAIIFHYLLYLSSFSSKLLKLDNSLLRILFAPKKNV